MKKILTGVLAVSLLASLAISASALEDAERTDVTVYKNTPTIDGVINNGEWDQDNAIDITADNAMLWAATRSTTSFTSTTAGTTTVCTSQLTSAIPTSASPLIPLKFTTSTLSSSQWTPAE